MEPYPRRPQAPAEIGMPLAEFANANLFYPMQITDAVWARTPTGLPVGGSGLFLRPRDLAKFGQLYLDGGAWQGQQLISAEWVADSVVRRVDLSNVLRFSEGYGYQWWLDELPYRGSSSSSRSLATTTRTWTASPTFTRCCVRTSCPRSTEALRYSGSSARNRYGLAASSPA